ncbi:EamA family transporter [Alsobacter sp. R-9]
MTLLVFLAGLASAILHAGWNMATRQRPDPGTAFASVVIMSGVICVPPLLWLGLPSRESLVWMAVGAVFNVLTMRLIMATYRRMPFAVGYPMIRGTSPLAVALMGFGVFGERISTLGAGGVALISSGVFLLALSGRRAGEADGKGIALAIAAGLSNACFVLADARGVRLSGDIWTYGMLVAAVNALLLAVLMRLEKVDIVGAIRRTWAFSSAAAAVSMLSYFAILYGFTHGPTGPVSALRETSVFFGVLMAATILRERIGPLRWTAAGLAVAGIVLIRLS